METRTLATDLPDIFKQAVSEACALLAAGEVVALPTETVYGLCADALNADAVAKIFTAKDRPAYDPLIVHIPHKKDLDMVADVPPEIAATIKKLIDRFWPGPLTLVLPKKACVPDIVTSGQSTVAVRTSKDLVFTRIIRTYGKPLAAPSANRFGSISPTSASAVKAELDGLIPLIVDGGACMFGLESTIIKVEPDSPKARITILRPGPITVEDLKLFGRVVVPGKTKVRGPTGPASIAPLAPEVPGQLASHYAPKTPLRLLESPADFIPEEGKRYALLSYRGEPDDGYIELVDWAGIQVLSPGKGKLPEAAVRFFYALRELDKLGVDEIIAEPMATHGQGLAMMDRLTRAAAKR